jgi:hypothetical protein
VFPLIPGVYYHLPPASPVFFWSRGKWGVPPKDWDKLRGTE